ncbi:hypothetical protein [Desulfovibrio inopinatus]|uniref:hypothetical protein n=1 Tax=Desulfovibrio inopinatus TaxID=102109 RepID=UPI000482820F|nr:hypothetical protein [Desulfovibrio inopinatus]
MHDGAKRLGAERNIRRALTGHGHAGTSILGNMSCVQQGRPMDTTMQLLFALVMGVLSVELFSRAWLGFLGILADMVLFFRKKRQSQAVMSRLGMHLGIALLCSLSLILCFHLYLVRYGLGKTESEQLFYFLASVVRLTIFIKDIGRHIDALFSCDQDADDDP